MLLRLTIRDFIIVDSLELEFASGFGTLTGETGAGKSILIDALSFVLGERAESGLIRPGAERAEVNAAFDIAALPAVIARLSGIDIDATDGLLLRRVIDRNGRSRAYLNGTPATVQQLREVSGDLLDIHGQHAHQSLLRADAQRDIVDAVGGHMSLLRDVAGAWREWRRLHERWQSALAGGEAMARERGQLEWETEELAALGFIAEEWQELNAEQGRLAHAATLAEGAQWSLQGLVDAEPSCFGTLGSICQRLDELAGYDSRLASIAELLRSAEAEVGEAAAELRRYADHVDLDPARLAEIDRRIDAILGCARKYRVSPEDLPLQLASRRQRLLELEAGSDPAALEAEASKARERYRDLAAKLGAARRQTAAGLAREVSARMQELALAGGRFDIALQPLADGSAAGDERVEFLVGGLAGGEMRSLAKVASGGELSRISLAIQVVASQAASVPTLIFDEVDVGIGGGVAEVVGRLLRSLGERRQVLCVTHLPQVAAQADWQWRVVKHKEGDIVRSEVQPLDDGARIEEIARMLGGVEITATTRQHAREMLGVR